MKNFLLLILFGSLNISCGVTNEKIQVYMTPSCGCCKKWVSYLISRIRQNRCKLSEILTENEAQTRKTNRKPQKTKHTKRETNFKAVSWRPKGAGPVSLATVLKRLQYFDVFWLALLLGPARGGLVFDLVATLASTLVKP